MALSDECLALRDEAQDQFLQDRVVPAQRHYTGRVETFWTREKRGGNERLEGAEEIGLAVLKTMNRIANTMDGILDVMRYSVSFTFCFASVLTPLIHRSLFKARLPPIVDDNEDILPDERYHSPPPPKSRAGNGKKNGKGKGKEPAGEKPAAVDNGEGPASRPDESRGRPATRSAQKTPGAASSQDASAEVAGQEPLRRSPRSASRGRSGSAPPPVPSPRSSTDSNPSDPEFDPDDMEIDSHLKGGEVDEDDDEEVDQLS